MKKGFMLGLATGVVLTGASLAMANSEIQAILNNQIKVSLNGKVQEFRDETTGEIQYPITYKDRTYLPLRNVAQLSGLKVDYDEKTNTAILVGQEKQNEISSTTSKTVNEGKTDTVSSPVNENETDSTSSPVNENNTDSAPIPDTSDQENDINNYSYDIVVEEWNDELNKNMMGGYATIYKATLVNTNKKEMYKMTYSDVWSIHEERGDKDSVTIEVHKLSDKKLSSITSKYKSSKSAKVKSFIESKVKVDYDLKVINETIDNIQYDLVIDTKVNNISESSEKPKTSDKVYAVEHYYELLNSRKKIKYKVYCQDLAEVFNNDGESDGVIVECYNLTDEELNGIISSSSTSVSNKLGSLTELLKDKINDEYEIRIVEH